MDIKQEATEAIREEVAEAKLEYSADMLRELKMEAKSRLQELVSEWWHDQIYDWIGDCYEADGDPADEYQPEE